MLLKPSLKIAPQWALLLALCLPTMGLAQMSAARVMSVTGDVRVVDAQGKSRALEKGAEVRSGEKIVTADGALAQIRLNDGGFMSIRPGTEMVIDRFHYDEKNASNSNLLISLLRGGMRSISGLIGKTNPDGYQIKSGTATVGIRGTDHEPMVIPPGVPELAKLGVPGLYDKVNDGETFIRNQGGLLSIKRGEVGFAAAAVAAANLPPQPLRVIPDFYKIDLKVDARDPKEAATIDGMGKRVAPVAGGLLRPTTAARREALIQSGALQPVEGGALTERAASGSMLNTGGAASALKSGALVLNPGVIDTGAAVAPVATTPVSGAVLQPIVLDSSNLMVAPIAAGAVEPAAVNTVATPKVLSTNLSPAVITNAGALLSSSNVTSGAIGSVAPAPVANVAPAPVTTFAPLVITNVAPAAVAPAPAPAVAPVTTFSAPLLSTTTINKSLILK